MRNQTQYGLWYLLGAVVIMLLMQFLVQSTVPVEHVSYSVFRSYLKDGKVASVTIGRDQILGNLKPVDGKEGSQISAIRVAPELAADLEQFGVEVRGTPDSSMTQNILSWFLPSLIFFGLWFLVMRGFGGKGGIGSGLMTIGKSNAKVYVETNTKVTFNDVAGVDEAKEELKEVVDFLKDPKTLGRLGARVPRGILLVGPPGTGKTLLARAVAGEAGVPFFSMNGSEFVEMFVGVGAARVRDLFDQARQHSPAIIFIDELDALGRARNANAFGGGHDEKEQTLNQLLSELDGFDAKSGLVLLAATNRPEILDPALLRAGRFDRQVLVDRPDRKGRAQIAEIYLRRVHRASDATAEAVAALTPGFTGADLANLVNEAAMAATRRNGDAVSLADITVAIERIVAGLEKRNRILNEAERKTIAYHEMGHALVSLVLSNAERVHKVSIIPRGIGALGYTIQRPTEDRYLMTEDELATKMAVLLGGRAAEQLIFDKVSTGAADDLAKATDLARSMVTQYGMSKALGGVSYDRPSAPMLGQGTMEGWLQRRYSEETAREIDCAVRDLVSLGLASALNVLSSRRAALERGAEELLARETLLESDILRLLDQQSASPPAATTRAA